MKVDSKVLITSNLKGSYTGRVMIRKSWLDKLGITEEEREITLELKENKIIIKKGVDKVDTI